MPEHTLEAQDLTTCHGCGEALTTTPRLGEFIMHPKCEETARRYFNEGRKVAKGRAIALIEQRINQWRPAGGFHNFVVAAKTIRDDINGVPEHEQ